MATAPFKKMNFFTSDGVRIVGNFYEAANPESAVLFLHMMPATKESWDHVALSLAEKRIASLAIDLRGHGESVRKGNILLDYKQFSDKEHQGSKLDGEAALTLLQEKTDLPLSRIALVGASIGANLALQTLADHPDIKKGVALSPGLNYRGIQPKSMVARLAFDQEILYVTSQDDEGNADMTQELYDATSSRKELKKFVSAGHGTTMLEREANAETFIIEFLSRR